MFLENRYELNGNRIGRKDISGKEIVYEYDHLDRMSKVVDNGHESVIALGSYDWTIPGTGVNSVSSTITIALAQAIYDSIMKESKKSKNKKVGQISIDSMSSPYKPSYGY